MITPKEQQLVDFLHQLNNPWIMSLFTVLVVWSLMWKGVALWRAARNNQITWYVIMLFVNTVGILEIIYLFWFSKKEGPRE